MDTTTTTNLKESGRKRMRIDSPKSEDLFQGSNTATSDDLNAAFSTSTYDDETIAPTQFEVGLDRTKKTKRESNGQNKENERYMDKMFERSPTVLRKRLIKKEFKEANESKSADTPELNEVSHVRKTKSMSILSESSKWYSKSGVKNVTPRRLFENKVMEENTSPTNKKNLVNSRNKSILAIGTNAPRLKQSTIKFPKVRFSTILITYKIDRNKRFFSLLILV